MSVTADCPICEETLNAANKGVIPYSLFSHAANNHEGFMENIGCIGKVCPYCEKEVRDEYQLCTHIISHTRPWVRIANKHPNFPLPKKYRDEVQKRLQNDDIPQLGTLPATPAEPTDSSSTPPENTSSPSSPDTDPEDTSPPTQSTDPPQDPDEPSDGDHHDSDNSPSKGTGSIEKVDLNEFREPEATQPASSSAKVPDVDTEGDLGPDGSLEREGKGSGQDSVVRDSGEPVSDVSGSQDRSGTGETHGELVDDESDGDDVVQGDKRGATILGTNSVSESVSNDPNISLDKTLQMDNPLENLLEITQNFINSSDRGSGGGEAAAEAPHMSNQPNQLGEVKELLSDAVDDLIDQKLDKKDNLTRIAKNLEGLDKGQEQFQNEITNLSQEVKNTVSNVQNDVSTLNKEIEGKMSEIDNDVKETVNNIDEKVNQKVDKIDEDVSQKVEQIDSTMTERVNQVHEQLETIDDRIEENISEFSEERKQILTEAEKARLEDLQVVANQINEGFQEIGTKLAETFERKTEPEDAVTHDQFKQTMTQMQSNIQEVLTETKQELQPALAVAQNFKQAVGQAPCDNCGKPVTIDQTRCDNCGGQVYWEL